MSGCPDTETVLRLLHDDYARCILTKTSEEPMSAKELSTACDASLSTVYRRVDELETTGLLATETEYDSDGDHFERYRAAIDRVGVAIEDGDLSMELSSVDDRADRFTRAWEGIRGGDG